MAKYISIETTNSGVLLIPTGIGLPILINSNNIALVGGNFELPISCVNANQQLIDNINEAIVSSAQGSYTDVVFPVTIPNGVEVLGIDFGGGRILCEYFITVSPSAPYPIQFVYIDEFGGFNSIEILNDGIIYGPYIGECGTMQIDQFATPVDPNEVNILESPLLGGGPIGPVTTYCQYSITVSTNASTPIQFTYIDEFGGFNSIEIQNDGLEYGPYIAECGTMQINQFATPVDPNLVEIQETPL